MRFKLIVLLSMLLIIILGCAGSSSMLNNLSVGMTKAEVIDVLGTPDYTSGKKDTEILCYKLTSGGLFTDSFYVIVKQGTVDRFGRQGDFGIYY
jgi:hypothetical protein